MRVGILALMIAVGIVAIVPGCTREHTLVDCGASCVVIDADTMAPIDSAAVYVTYVDYFQTSYGPYFRGMTDEEGKLSFFVGCDGFEIVDVEKTGYVSGRQVTHGGGELLFALEALPPVESPPTTGKLLSLK